MGLYPSAHACSVTNLTEEVFHHNIVQSKYDWTVANFQKLSFTPGQCTTSQRLKINIDGTYDEWEIVLYPGGYNERTADFLSVWLRRVSTCERLVQFTCEISPEKQSELEDSKPFVKKTIKQKLSLESVLGWAAFCKRSQILAENSGILNDGNLKLKCILQVFDDTFIQNPAVEDEDPNMDATESELSKNFGELLKSKDTGDVTFEINGASLRAHRVILSARSSVFRTMFALEKEKDSQKIKIKDIGKDAFLAMLQFIYSGKHTRVDFETLMELYYAADKYELMSLRRICSKILASRLNTENAVQIVTLAHQHCDIFLQDICVDYIAKNGSVVQKRQDWIDLMKSSPTLANVVFQCLMQMNEKSK